MAPPAHFVLGGRQDNSSWWIQRDTLDAIAGGAEGARVRYYVDGYSTKLGSVTQLYLGTYEAALKYCKKYGVDPACITEVVFY